MYESYIKNIDKKDIKLEEISFLGWEPKPNTNIKFENSIGELWSANIDVIGSRKGKNFKDTLVSVYGNSFAFCDEVNDNETWPYYLSEELKSSVLNFGVGGYGIDQAILRLEKKINQGVNTPITILCIYEEDINRCFNIFRPLIAGELTWKLFKPRFIHENNNLKLIHNPLYDIVRDDFAELTIEKMNKYDDWFIVQNNLAKIEFPFTLVIIKLMINYLSPSLTSEYLPPFDYWGDMNKTKLVDLLIERFYLLSEVNSFEPIIVFIPRLFKNKSPLYKDYFSIIKDKYKNKIKFLDISKVKFDLDKFNISPFEGHASKYGNKVISDNVYHLLKMEKEDKTKN